MVRLTRNAVRQSVSDAGLSCPTEDQITILHGHIARELIAFNGIRETYRVSKIKGRSIRVKAFYFKDRQGVTFEDDGFVGIAGWADEVNVQPILRALLSWVQELQTATEAAQ